MVITGKVVLLSPVMTICKSNFKSIKQGIVSIIQGGNEMYFSGTLLND